MPVLSPLLDHAAFGNGRVLALVPPSSASEWLCLPRCDWPSIVARLLDADRGGTFRILAGEEELGGVSAYLQNATVVSTRFEQDGDAWEVVDFAPRIPDGMSVRAPIEITFARRLDSCRDDHRRAPRRPRRPHVHVVVSPCRAC
jgi:alpha,alpha-trehalase